MKLLNLLTDATTAANPIMILAFIMIMMIFIFVFAGVLYFLNAYPLYKIAKKLDYDKSFLPWIPIFQSYICLFTIADLPGRRDFYISPKFDSLFKIKDRKKSYTAVIIIIVVTTVLSYFASFFSTFLMSFLSAFMEMNSAMSAIGTAIPALLSLCIALPLSLITGFLLGIFQYAYIRDLIDLFKPDREQNKKTALIIVIINNFTAGLALPIYLMTLQQYDPLPIAPEGMTEEAYYAPNFNFAYPSEPPYYPETEKTEEKPEETHIHEKNEEILINIEESAGENEKQN